MKKALLVSTSGLGDVVSGLYVANPLSEAGYQVSFLINDGFIGVFSDTVYLEYPISVIPNEHYDLVIDLTSDSSSRKVVAKVSGAQKVGRFKSWLQRLKCSRFYTEQVPKSSKNEHIVYDFAHILKALNLNAGSTTMLSTTLAMNKTREVCIHIGARNRLRCIPYELILCICHYLESQQIPIRLIGSEVDIAEKILEQTNRYPTYEQSNLGDVKRHLFNAALVIAPDSGIFHLASALGVPVIGLYGPNTYARSGSINPNAHCIELEYPCRPCNQNKPCPYNVRCLEEIRFEQLKPLLENALAL